MPKPEQTKEATGDVAVLYWSPESANLIVGNDPQIKFVEHVVRVSSGNKKVLNVLDRLPWFGKDYYRVKDNAGDEDYKVRFMAYLRNLILGDTEDQVKLERGIVAVTNLFTDDERAEHKLSLSNPNPDALIYAAINNKYVEGIV